jgi:hypothetical protein
MDTHIYHAFNADDIASSTVPCDKNKIIVAQNIACGYGSLMRFKTCTSLPTLMGEWYERSFVFVCLLVRLILFGLVLS